MRWGWFGNDALDDDDDVSNSRFSIQTRQQGNVFAGMFDGFARNREASSIPLGDTMPSFAGSTLPSVSVRHRSTGADSRPGRRNLESFSPEDMHMSELRTDATEDDEQSRQCWAWCFPLHTLAWAPSCIQSCVPDRWQNVVDCTHIFILIGSFSALMIVIANAYYIFGLSAAPCPETEHCEWEWVAFLSIVPNLSFFCWLLGQYDQDLGKQAKGVMKQRQEIFESYDMIVSDIDDFIGKATQTSAVLTEGAFELKRRDFIRFLDRMEEQGRRIVFQKSTRLPDEFRRFVQAWLLVFSECSVDPAASPKHVATAQELRQHLNISDIARFVRERLALSEVKFISAQANQDQQIMQNVQEVQFAFAGGAAVSSIDSMAEGEQQGRRCCPCEWLVCGRVGCHCFCCRSGDDPGSRMGFPRSSQCFCCLFQILSKSHLILLVGYVFALLVAVLLLFDWLRTGRIESWVNSLFYIAFCIAALLVLINYETIHTIKQLTREINRLQEESDRLSARRAEMTAFWGKVQRLTDIWMHRTAPRLDLLKEVHVQIESLRDPDQLESSLRGINDNLEALEGKLPPLELWQEGGQLTGSAKKQFAKSVRNIYEKALGRLPMLMDGINHLADDGVKKLTRTNFH